MTVAGEEARGGMNITIGQKQKRDAQGARHQSKMDIGGGRWGWSLDEALSTGQGGQSRGDALMGRQPLTIGRTRVWDINVERVQQCPSNNTNIPKESLQWVPL